jgi:membrane protease YdiL (CAAX protease family)
MAFILGIWLWDHYMVEPKGYAPGTESMALLKIDRDLRLADAMAGDPEWLRWFAGADTQAAAANKALRSLKKLHDAGSLGISGIEAMAVIHAVSEGVSIGETLNQVMRGPHIPDFAGTDHAAGPVTWWQAQWAESQVRNGVSNHPFLDRHAQYSLKLRTRAIAARSSVWLLALAGLAFVPRGVRCLATGFSSQPRGYGGAWPVTLGLVVFLAATLAWIGFGTTIDIGLAALPAVPSWMGIALDSFARLLPALIAMGLLFRRPSHAIRVMGLDGPVPVRSILGIFTLLLLVDQPLRWATGQFNAADPGSGISAAEAGLAGLAFAVISSCIVAPVAEEILYRGVLFRALWNRLGAAMGALLSSAVFASLHFYGVYGLASVAVFGFVTAVFYAATRSLGAVIALHILYNLSIKVPEWIFYHAPLD